MKDALKIIGAFSVLAITFIFTVLIITFGRGAIVYFVWDRGLVHLFGNYINTATFIQVWLLTWTINSIRTRYLADSTELKDPICELFKNKTKKNEMIARAISVAICIVFFAIDCMIVCYTYKNILPEVFKFNLPVLTTEQIIFSFIGLNILFSRKSASNKKDDEKK